VGAAPKLAARRLSACGAFGNREVLDDALGIGSAHRGPLLMMLRVGLVRALRAEIDGRAACTREHHPKRMMPAVGDRASIASRPGDAVWTREPNERRTACCGG